MAAKKVLVFVGSVREGRFGLRVARTVHNTLKSLNVDAALVGEKAIFNGFDVNYKLTSIRKRVLDVFQTTLFYTQILSRSTFL
jgi:hypothetical protein